ncbi:unnamed protein product [Euphydryas editha]|uniref:Uncharacterized protein n=1 Tax=Euphydryas editha TaxID=104508 RepID=A0AAU9TG66_EUPED|nr:unnamed protein product [Euphydryas editha]
MFLTYTRDFKSKLLITRTTNYIGDPEHEHQRSLRKATSSSLPQAFEQRVIQPASIHGYYGYPDHKHAADAHSWSSPTAFAATLAQHTALRPVSKQRRTSLLVDAAASHYAALHHPDSLGHHRRQFRLTVNYAASGSDSLEHSTGPASITRCSMDDSTCYRPPVSEGE